jgi:protein-tyrosine phosphatase
MTLSTEIPVDHVADGVYISGWRATKFAEELRTAGITNVLKLYPDTPFFPEDFNVLENVIEDGEPVSSDALRRGTDFILDRVEAGQSVLVVCGAGVSRSSTFVLSYLLSKGQDLESAFRLLRKQHPQASPHPELWRSLLAYHKLDHPLTDVVRWNLDL